MSSEILRLFIFVSKTPFTNTTNCWSSFISASKRGLICWIKW